MYSCTRLYEYLEAKTTSHHFEDLDTCLGADETKWGYAYSGPQSNISMSSDGAVVTSFPPPLKITHAANCSGTAPTLTLQLTTYVTDLRLSAYLMSTSTTEAISVSTRLSLLMKLNSGRKVTIQSHAFGTYLSCDAGGDTSCSGNGFSASVSTSVGDAEKFMLGTDKGSITIICVRFCPSLCAARGTPARDLALASRISSAPF